VPEVNLQISKEERKEKKFWWESASASEEGKESRGKLYESNDDAGAVVQVGGFDESKVAGHPSLELCVRGDGTVG
jgi:hypothetical protein